VAPGTTFLVRTARHAKTRLDGPLQIKATESDRGVKASWRNGRFPKTLFQKGIKGADLERGTFNNDPKWQRH